MPVQPDCVLLVIRVVQHTCSIEVADRCAIHPGLDSGSPTADPKAVPGVLLIRVVPRPSRGSGRGIDFPVHERRANPAPRFPGLVIDQSGSPACSRVDVDLRTIEPACVVVIPLPNLHAGIPRNIPVDLDVHLKLKVRERPIAHEPYVVVVAVSGGVTEDRPIIHAPEHLFLVCVLAGDVPAVEGVAIE